MKRLALLAGTAFCAVLSGFAIVAASADPVDDTLVVDGVEVVTRAPAPEGHPFDEVLSGWLFREAETRAAQMDSFENPGMLGAARGEDIWNTVEGSMGNSCASCHGNAAETMRGVGASYPKWDEASGKPINVELRIDKCRVEHMGAEPYKVNAPDQVALTTYVKHQSHGMPVKVNLSEGHMQSWWDHGKDVYYTRNGQLNFACASCHESSMGKYIRADHLSQGQANGFPTYRFRDGRLVSLTERLRGCFNDTRGEMPEAFSDELLALELYVTWRGTGLSVETPAVRQ